jgi:heme o synthase
MEIGMIKDYIKLTKPGIIVGNAITAISGYFMGMKNGFQPLEFFAMLLGLIVIIGSGCVFNNYKDRFIDQKMERTKARALVQGIVSEQNALRFGSTLVAFAITILALFTNTLTLMFAVLGFIVYVNVYTPLKLKSEHGTLIGSIAGAVPPVVGYTASAHSFDLCALLLFLMITFWQMPHFYAIAIYRSSDYKNADIPVLPLVKGFYATKIQMMYYTCLYVLSSLSFYFFKFSGTGYFYTALTLGMMWLIWALKGFQTKCDIKWAKIMFRLSLVVVMGISIALSFKA